MSSSTTAFAALPSHARAALLASARQLRFPAGATVLHEGARAESFYAVASGEVKMCRLTPGGKNLILSLFGPGDLFGVTPALSGDPCDATFEAVVATEALEVRRVDLYALFTRRPELLGEVLPYLTHRLQECRNCLVETSCSRVENRFASLFLGLATRLGRAPAPAEQAESDSPRAGDTFIPLPLTRQELADLTGTTLETAIRVMSRWGKQGIVATRRDGFLLRDRRNLEALAGA
jgi:CRP-like cAMP-binding protein